MLNVQQLSVEVDHKLIIDNVSLTVKKGEVVALMGPNGSGKSTLALSIMGHPKYVVTSGDILLDGASIKSLAVDERARKGLFLSFQYPSEIEGVTVANFLRQAYSTKTGKTINVLDFYKSLYPLMDTLKMDHNFAKRYVNVGFSGGEKKRLEALQLTLLSPRFAILDETDSGLDIDALKIIASTISAHKDMGILLITHYTRILQYLKPDRVLVMKSGKIVREGGPQLAHELEKSGFEPVIA